MAHPQYGPASQAPPPWPPQAPVQRAAGSRLLPILGVALGLLGLIAGLAAWFRPLASTHSAEPAYSEQQVSDARKAVCEAYKKGVQALQVAGEKKPDPADWLPVAVNTRLAETAMGNYLINVLSAHPATAPELSEAITELALNYQEMAVMQLADKRSSDYESNTRATGELIPKINQLCT